ncbi:MAG: Hsp20/alpha crystallin family protein [Clostridia bacterium]|nr:Hsp20/alpha crystallin family protein [Clostridia bacterium]
MITYRTRSPFLTQSRLFDDFMRPFFSSPVPASFRVDVKDLGDSYLMEAELPGVERDNVEIDLDDGVLTIRAEWNQEKKDENKQYLISERRYGKVERSFSVENIREDEIKAEYVNGILKLTLPKKTPESRQLRKIEIQ